MAQGEYQYTSSVRQPRAIRKKTGKKPKLFLRILGFILLLIVLITTAYAGYINYKLDGMLNKVSIAKSPQSGETSSAPVALDKPITILMMGMDTRKQTNTLNTDVIMVAVLNPKTRSASVLSIPRDTYIRLKGFPRGKANALYGHGEIERIRAERDHETITVDGPSYAKEAFGKFLDLPIDYYVTVDFDGFRGVIDALDGIEVNVDQDMRYVDDADGTNINLRKGLQVLDGKNALDFVRFRKSNRGGPQSNDIERNARQQLVLTAVLDKMKSFDGLMKLGQMIDVAGDHLRTDVPSEQIKALFKTYSTVDRNNIHFMAIKGEWKSPYIIVDSGELNKKKAALEAEWTGMKP